jgi:hypothetical protein
MVQVSLQPTVAIEVWFSGMLMLAAGEKVGAAVSITTVKVPAEVIAEPPPKDAFAVNV